MTIEKTYNGQTIIYNETTDEWWCEALRMSAAKLSDLEKRIDKHGEQEKKFDRFQAYWNSYREWQIVTVTSFTDEGKQAWTTNQKKRREKAYRYNLYPVNEHNAAIYEKIQTIDSEIEKLQEARGEHLAAMISCK